MASAPRQVPSTRSPRRHHAAATTSDRDASGPATASHSSVGGGAVEEPGERAVHRLVVGQRRRADPARVEEPVGPVRRRRARHRREPDRDGGREGHHAPAPPPHGDRPAPAARRTRAGSASRPPRCPPAHPTSVVPAGRRSTSTASIRSRLTWPNARFCHTGSRASAPTVTSATSQPGAGRPSARRTTTTTAAERAHRRPGPQRRREPRRQQRQRHHHAPPRTAGR